MGLPMIRIRHLNLMAKHLKAYGVSKAANNHYVIALNFKIGMWIILTVCRVGLYWCRDVQMRYAASL